MGEKAEKIIYGGTIALIIIWMLLMLHVHIFGPIEIIGAVMIIGMFFVVFFILISHAIWAVWHVITNGYKDSG